MTTVALNPSATLLRILSRSANTEIGKRWNFASIQSVDDFRRNVPLTDYEVYRPYIQRMMDSGEKDLIVCGDVVYYAPTSGTTSKIKYIPKYANFKGDEMKHAMLGPTAMFANMPREKTEWTPLGVPIIPGSSNLLRALLSVEPYTFPAPPKAYYIADLTDALYVQMVFALKMVPVNTSVIASIFISTVIARCFQRTC